MGTWKLAYADFLTALVAFFIVMWLVKGVPEAGREDLAGYFRKGEISAEAGEAAVIENGPSRAEQLALDLGSTELFRSAPETLSVIAQGDRVRIDLADRTANPVFEPGEAAFTEAGRAIARRLAGLVSQSSGPVEIEGHTDAFPYRGKPGGNWALSSERAQMAYRHLSEAGLDPGRVKGVTGRGASLPRYPDEPHLPANRRITIILHIAE
jgi:chemotaxis protein MotB